MIAPPPQPAVDQPLTLVLLLALAGSVGLMLLIVRRLEKRSS
jgi:hypothetical protein